ncbi:MAG TPA: sigma-70 family RNA polymerase sigma factor [Propionibacteriaceae bacterium]|nr:sigma-70 family RNA polymerase sigma factor [Propionibacteriaceae bacterium]
MITANTGLVGYVVSRMAARDNVDPEELYAWGMEGLVQAAECFDSSRGLSFATYAIHRIRGRILDELRRADPLPRPLRSLVKRLAQARLDLGHELGREPTRIELADELGISEIQLRRVEEASSAAIVSLDRLTGGDGEGGLFDIDDADTSVDPDRRAEKADLASRLRAAIAGLNERQRLVLQRCYVEEEPLTAIGRVLGVSPSRVSQIHREAVLMLRRRLTEVGAPEAA